MPNAARSLILAVAAAALAACHKQAAQQNQDLAIDQNLPANELPANAEIETLPPDESSTTPSSQLQNGYDNPDVNESGNSH
jgi:hypothetical protein